VVRRVTTVCARVRDVCEKQYYFFILVFIIIIF
jgi:hypothetical protein